MNGKTEEKVPEKKGLKIFSKFLTVIIIFLVLICAVLFFKIVTDSEVSIFGIKFYYVVTDSMYPTIKPNSMIVVRSVDPDTLKKGDIISFISRDEDIYGLVNTHRIVDIIEENGKKAFITMGDNNPSPDGKHVYPDEVQGKVIFHTPPMKAFTDFLSFAGTSTGFLIVIVCPLIIIFAMILRNFFKHFRAAVQEAEAEEREKIEARSEDSEAKKAAVIILEQFFGKKLCDITEEDIEKKLEELK